MTGSSVLTNAVPLDVVPITIPQRVDHWSQQSPDRALLTERAGNARRSITYQAADDDQER